MASRWPKKQRINKELLASGAAIGEMNCVRKHLSRIKGGRLAAACAPARVVTLTISDARATTLHHCQRPHGTGCQHLRRCAGDSGSLPHHRAPAVRAALEAGLLETPKPGDPVFAGHAVHPIATPQQSLKRRPAARAAGWAAHILSDEMKANRAKWARCTRPWPGRRGPAWCAV